MTQVRFSIDDKPTTLDRYRKTERRRFLRRQYLGFTLIEGLIAMSLTALGTTATLSMLTFTRLSNSIEQERARAHQMVSEELERVRFQLYSRITTGKTVTVWDNGTSDDSTDDTTGSIEVRITDPKTGAVLNTAPAPAKRVQVEVTLTWNPRGRLHGKTVRESVMTYIAP